MFYVIVPQPSLKRKYQSKILGLFDQPTYPLKYKDNLLKVEVYYDALHYEEVMDEPAYKVSKYTNIMDSFQLPYR